MQEKVAVNAQGIHTVKYGETLDDLAFRSLRDGGKKTTGKDVEAQKQNLITWNRDALPDLARNPDLLQPGWTMRMAPCAPAEVTQVQPAPPVVEPVDRTKVPPVVAEPVDKTKVPPVVAEPVDKTKVPPVVAEPVDKTKVPPVVAEPVDKTKVPPGEAVVTQPVTNQAIPSYGDAYFKAKNECAMDVPWRSALTDGAIGFGAGGILGRFVGWRAGARTGEEIGGIFGFRGKALGTALGALAGGIVGFTIGGLNAREDCVQQKMNDLDAQFKKQAK
jgi:hypothetical protein